MIQIFNEDCIKTIKNRLEVNSIDVVLTSPPYNNSRTSHTEYCMQTSNCRYDAYDDNKTNEEYCSWVCDIFNNLDRVIKKDGCILWNVSYGIENPTCMFECISEICKNTNFTIADVLVWKKKSAFPNNVSSNKLTRICEFVFVFCRADEYYTFHTNKKVVSIQPRTGQKFYQNIFNLIEAENNDGVNELNNATYSTDFCLQLLNIYAKQSSEVTVYDPFMGTGTTALACKRYGVNCFGSELSEKQCEYANERIKFDGIVSNKEEVDNNKENLWN